MRATFDTLTLFGGGGHCSDALSIIEALPERRRARRIVICDTGAPSPARFAGRDVELRTGVAVDDIEPTEFVTTIGYPAPRRSVTEHAMARGFAPAAALVHPSTSVGHGVSIGQGTLVFGNVWLSPLVNIGDHACVSYGTTIGHDTGVGDFVSVMPGATVSGEVEIGEAALIGAGAVVLQGIRIGAEATVGAGAVVTHDVPPGSTVVGMPARPLDTQS